MTMRYHYLVTHWTPEEAHTILNFLDQLRDLICQTYGSEMAAMLQEAQHQEEDEPAPGTSMPEDGNPF